MAGADRSGKYELEQWKKALLSRDFDLVHTQLLMLDGDVTPAERIQLVREIFNTVQQIEELTTGKVNPQGADPTESSPQAHQSEPTPPATSLTSRPMFRADSEESDEPVTGKRSRHIIDRAKGPRIDVQKRYVRCPVCNITGTVGKRNSIIRDDWYCNSCRLFKLRLDRKFAEGKELPTCAHKGSEIFRCKGCRRFKLQTFWLDKRERNTPYQLPMMGSEESSSDVETSDPE